MKRLWAFAGIFFLVTSTAIVAVPAPARAATLPKASAPTARHLNRSKQLKPAANVQAMASAALRAERARLSALQAGPADDSGDETFCIGGTGTGVIGGITVEPVPDPGTVDPQQYFSMVAVLFNQMCSDGGTVQEPNDLEPLAGQKIYFAVEQENGIWSQACTATTDSNGVASCESAIEPIYFDGVPQFNNPIGAWSVVYEGNYNSLFPSATTSYTDSSDYGRIPNTPTPAPTPKGDGGIEVIPNYNASCSQPNPDDQATMGDLLTDGGNCQLTKIEGIVTTVVFSIVLSVIGGDEFLESGWADFAMSIEKGEAVAQATAKTLAQVSGQVGGRTVSSGLSALSQQALVNATGLTVGQLTVGGLVGLGTAYANGTITVPSSTGIQIGAGTTLDNTGVIYNEGTLSDDSASGGGTGLLINDGTILNVDGGTIPGRGQGGISGLEIEGNNYTLNFDTSVGQTPASMQVYAPSVAASDQSLPTVAAPAGMVFQGWYTSNGVLVTNGADLSELGSGPLTTTLTAHFGQAAAIVNVNPNLSGNACTPYLQLFECATLDDALAYVNGSSFAGQNVTIQLSPDSPPASGSTTIAPAADLGSLTIAGWDGIGANTFDVDGNGEGPVVTVTSGTVTLADLGITGGQGTFTVGSNNQPELLAGGVLVDPGANVTLDNDSLSEDSAPFGGGVVNDGGTVTISDSNLSDDSASEAGGGLYSYDGGTTTLVNDTLTGDTAPSGGAIYLTDGGSVALTNDTLAWDNAGDGSGGINVGSPDAGQSTVTIANSILDSAGCAVTQGGTVVDNGYNVESDDSCGLGATSLVDNSAIELASSETGDAPLAIPATSSATLEVPTGQCSVGSDELGAARPDDGEDGCDAGAVDATAYLPAPPVMASAASDGEGGATVSWSASAFDGGNPITEYTVTATDTTNPANGGETCYSYQPNPDTCVVLGLTNGDTYSFTVTATTDAGTSAPSSPLAIVEATGADSPTGVNASPADGQATVSWTPPANTGGEPVLTYDVTAIDLSNSANGGEICEVILPAADSCTVPDLTDGDTYDFTVVANNGAGTGSEGISNEMIPAGLPGAPSVVGATGGNAGATVTWAAPADDGGAALTGFTVTATDSTNAANGGQTCSSVQATDTSCTVSGLTNGDSYTFTVTATNSVGTGAASSASAVVVPATVPDAPGGLTVAPGNDQASVSWTSPDNDGGSAVIGYTVTATDTTNPANGGQTCSPALVTDTSCTIAALTIGDSYTYTATATNSVGTGAASGSSAAVVAQAVPVLGSAVDDATTKAPWAGYETSGAKAYDTATLSETVAGVTPTGTVTYQLFHGTDCTGSVKSVRTVTVGAGGVVPPSARSKALTSGAFSYQATYSGDAYNESVTGPCQAFHVVPNHANLAISLSGSKSAAAGATFSETATASNAGPAPAGQVTVTMTIPTGVTVTSTDGGTIDGTTIVWAVGQVLPGHSDSFTAGFAVPATAKRMIEPVTAYVVSATVPDPNARNNLAIKTIILGGAAG